MKKLNNILKNTTLQSILFGATVTLLVAWLWDAPIKKFKVEVDPMVYENPENRIWLIDDFNGDGNSERIRCHFKKGINSMDIVYYDNAGNLLENYHYPGYNWNLRLEPKIFDTDEDGIKELLYFDERNDSIFFNAVNLKDFSLQIDHHFFQKIQRHRDSYYYQSNFYKLGDFNNDGIKELFFSFDAGFGLYPRGIFKMEFPSLKITASPTDHMVTNNPKLADLNNDGVPEILPDNGSPCNSPNAKKYPDTCAYLITLDYNLQPLFTPIKMPGNYGKVHCIPSNTSDSLFFALHCCKSNAQNPAEVMVMNSKGEILQKKEWHNIENPENMSFDLCILNEIPYLIIKNVGRFKLTPDLANLPNELSPKLNEVLKKPTSFDFDHDGMDELIMVNDQEITILSEKTSESVTFRSPIPLRNSIKLYPFKRNNKVTQYALTSQGGFFFLNYQQNPYYWLLYLIYLSIFLTTAVAIRMLLYFQQKNIEKKWETEQQLSELQFNAVKNQLNPHFLFNALNSVAYMINEGRNDEAYDFLALNSRMIQRVMNDAKEIKRPLKDELSFTKDYINVQKHRFKNRFKPEFIVAPKVNQNFMVPKMCIHTYVENAIKHGLRNTKSGGLLKIEISPLNNGVNIVVTDNGMGRKAASAYKDSSGNGLNIMSEYYRLFERYHGYKIECNIGDVKPSGTVVQLTIKLQ